MQTCLAMLKIMDDVKGGKSKYHFLLKLCHVLTAVYRGAGQPLPTTKKKREARKQAIYKEKQIEIRKKSSQDNPQIANVYDDYLENLFEEKAHKLLHVPDLPP